MDKRYIRGLLPSLGLEEKFGSQLEDVNTDHLFPKPSLTCVHAKCDLADLGGNQFVDEIHYSPLSI